MKIEFDFDTTKFTLSNALILAEASKLAYESQSKIIRVVKCKWKFDQCKFFDKRNTQAFVAGNKEGIILSFRGTEEKGVELIRDWLTNFKVRKNNGPWKKGVHRGFLQAIDYVWNDIVKEIERIQPDTRHPLWITGHSLGGALATLAAAKFLEGGRTVKGLYTFGQPRVGSEGFAEKFNNIFRIRSFRFVNNEDIVTRVPPRSINYGHIGSVVYFDSFGNLHKDIRWWRKFLDRSISKSIRALDRYDMLKEQFPGGLKDHCMDEYIRLIDKS
jgi:triacylglycerol lipase